MHCADFHATACKPGSRPASDVPEPRWLQRRAGPAESMSRVSAVSSRGWPRRCRQWRMFMRVKSPQALVCRLRRRQYAACSIQACGTEGICCNRATSASSSRFQIASSSIVTSWRSMRYIVFSSRSRRASIAMVCDEKRYRWPSASRIVRGPGGFRHFQPRRHGCLAPWRP